MKYSFFYVSLFLLVGCLNKEPEKTGQEGKPLPSMALLLADSTTILDTKSLPEDKPFVFFLFGPNCPYSRSQMQEIIDNNKSLQTINFYILTPYPFQQMKSFSNDYGLQNYSNMTVCMDRTNAFARHFAVAGVPFLAVFKKGKILKEAYIGKVTSAQIKSVALN